MTATSDLIIERRRVRRRLAMWRILAIVALVALVIVLVPKPSSVGGGDQIARLAVDGVIVDEPRRERLLERIAESDRVQALIVRINSPGGTAAGSEALFEAIRRVAEKKPVVAVMDEIAASGGYVTSLGGDRIFARQTTLTASIGVVAEFPNLKGLLDNVGIGVTRVKSGDLKAEPGIVEPPSPKTIAAMEELTRDSFAWFRSLVDERRDLTPEQLETISDGRVVTGRQALDLGLIDEIGGEQQALAWLQSAHDLDEDLKVRDWKWQEPDLPWPIDAVDSMFGGFLGGVWDLDLRWGPRIYAVAQ